MTIGSPSRRSAMLALTLVIVGAVLIGWSLVRLWPHVVPQSGPAVTVSPTVPPATATEPILPPAPTGLSLATQERPIHATPSPRFQTASPTATAVVGAGLSPTPSVGPGPVTLAPSSSFTPSSVPSATPVPVSKGLYSLRQRLGVGASSRRVTQEVARELEFGWYLDWTARADAFRSPEVEYLPMIRIKNGQPHLKGDALRQAVKALPGAVWLIGNEPDVKWQDNVPPEVYAQVYHDLYDQLKVLDPACQVAIGGVSQPTPLRMRYLNLILEAYQSQYGEPMPVDVWNVHNFILREERDSWGVDIPPGLTEQTGILYEITDHDDLTIFRQQIVEFRKWMRDRGQQDKPLIVSEYGILMPNEYGFPARRVEQFMVDTFEFFRTAVDPALGYAADGYRLVQRWCWFSLADPRYPTGNLVQLESGQLTPLGKAFRSYAESPH